MIIRRSGSSRWIQPLNQSKKTINHIKQNHQPLLNTLSLNTSKLKRLELKSNHSNTQRVVKVTIGTSFNTVSASLCLFNPLNSKLLRLYLLLNWMTLKFWKVGQDTFFSIVQLVKLLRVESDPKHNLLCPNSQHTISMIESLSNLTKTL